MIVDEYENVVLDRKYGASVSDCASRLTALGRASCTNICVATQHPTVKVLSSRMKANMTLRIALKVTSRINSRVILDCGGAEAQLHERGEMLIKEPFESSLKKIKGLYYTDREIQDAIGRSVARFEGRQYFLNRIC